MKNATEHKDKRACVTALNNYRAAAGGGNFYKTIAVSAVIGLIAGTVVTLYRFVLEEAEDLNKTIMSFARQNPYFIALVFIGLMLLAFLTGIIVKVVPQSKRGGVAQVKNVIRGRADDSWNRTLPAKFAGGAAAALGGLSLGREGPSVQLGAAVGDGVGKIAGGTGFEKRVYMAGGASAGLSAAFNAPLAAVIFCFEEIFGYFSPLILLSTMIAAVGADFVSKIFLGLSPVFNFPDLAAIPLDIYWLLPILGITLGVFAAGYSALSSLFRNVFEKIFVKHQFIRMFFPFALAGILALVFPYVCGGGYDVVVSVSPSSGLIFLSAVFLIKIIFTAFSYGSGAPGGIYFPLFAIGAAGGAVFALIGIKAGLDASLFYNFVVLAMAGYFAAVVRAPITGIVLMVETTGTFVHILPLTIVALTAYIVAGVLKSGADKFPLLYESEDGSPYKRNLRAKKITFEETVQIGSAADGRAVKFVPFPENCLLISVKRGDEEIIPDGNTVIYGGDSLIFITDFCEEREVRNFVDKIISA